MKLHLKLHRTAIAILASQLLLTGIAFGQAYKVQNVGPPPATELSKPVVEALESHGLRVVNEQGTPWLELWLAKLVPSGSSANASADVLYGSLNLGVFLGVLHFSGQGADFRGQAIKPGFYSLRYGLIPQDGNHMGVNPSRDALILCPAAVDSNPGTPLSFDDLVKMGRQSSGTAHPGFLVGAPANGGSFPSVVQDDQGHWNLQVNLHTSSGDLPIAFTIVGKWQG